MADLRKLALKSGNCRIATVEVDFDGSGEKHVVGVRQPSLAVRKKLYAITHDKVTPETQERQDIQTVIECACYAADEYADEDGTLDGKPVKQGDRIHARGDRMFTDHDFAGLRDQPVAWVRDVAREAGLMMLSGPAPSNCQADAKDEDGKQRKGEDGKALKCGAELRPYYRFCPVCGEAVADAMEHAKNS